MLVRVRRCVATACPRYHQVYRPEAEGAWALPHGEFGLDGIALVGALRFGEHRSVLELHQEWLVRGVQIAERTVTQLVQRYEELVALRLTDHTGLQARLRGQEHVVLAIDGYRWLAAGRGPRGVVGAARLCVRRGAAGA